MIDIYINKLNLLMCIFFISIYNPQERKKLGYKYDLLIYFKQPFKQLSKDFDVERGRDGKGIGKMRAFYRRLTFNVHFVNYSTQTPQKVCRKAS